MAIVFSFAGAAGCVATLLHDAAMNPAEGNDFSTFPPVGHYTCICRLLLYFWFAEERQGAPQPFWWGNPFVLPFLTSRGRPPHIVSG